MIPKLIELVKYDFNEEIERKWRNQWNKAIMQMIK